MSPLPRKPIRSDWTDRGRCRTWSELDPDRERSGTWHHGAMEEEPRGHYRELSRQEASNAVTGLGWRLVLGELRTEVRTGSLTLAADIAARAASAADADGRLRMDVRADRVIFCVQTAAMRRVTERDVELAEQISAVAAELGLETVSGGKGRSVQVLEIAIDALDAGTIRPFWRAVLGYADESVQSGPWDGLVDPLGQGPAVWFQRMDAPRPQRNRIHIDVSVPHDEAEPRIKAAIAAGGKVINDAEAPAFWVLADAEGNEACVTTWQGRDLGNGNAMSDPPTGVPSAVLMAGSPMARGRTLHGGRQTVPAPRARDRSRARAFAVHCAEFNRAVVTTVGSTSTAISLVFGSACIGEAG
jgi:4a-hydroxytetrahydrobiopterin dehydratase